MSETPMTRTPGDEVPEPEAAPGTFCWRQMDRDGQPPHRYLLYVCPRGQGYCGVPVAPGRLPNGAQWQHDGHDDQPTLTPSINCVGGCGWHGFIQQGVMRG